MTPSDLNTFCHIVDWYCSFVVGTVVVLQSGERALDLGSEVEGGILTPKEC